MKKIIYFGVAALFLSACSGCASNPEVGGQVLSGILMGIGAGLSGL